MMTPPPTDRMIDLDSLHAFPHAVADALWPLGVADLAAIAAAAVLQQLSARLGLWVYAVVALPGTLGHELAHYGMATVLRARPSLPTLLPRRQPDGWRLGAVTFQAGLLRSLPIAVAPLALAPLTWWLAAHTLAGRPVDVVYLLWTWACGALLRASLPSREDWRIAAPGLLVLAVLAAIGWAGWRWAVGP
jgi:hypothetical protein